MTASHKKEVALIFQRILLIFLIGYCLILALVFNFTNASYQQFVYLADSFLHGKLYFLEVPGSWADVVSFEGKLYWHLAPFPALLLAPFSLFWGTDFLQGYVNFLLTILNLYLLYLIALRLGIKEKIDALWLAVGYVFGTVYLGVVFASDAWRFAQVIATSLLLLVILEYLGKKRFLLIGLLAAFAFASRFNLLLVLSFFFLGILFEKESWQRKLVYSFKLVLPILIVGILLLLYNYARFKDPFQTGYYLSTFNALHAKELRIALQSTGKSLFSLTYLPTNLYYYLLKGPYPVLQTTDSYLLAPPFATFTAPGMRLGREFSNAFIPSMIFLFSLLANTKEPIVRQSWLAIFLVLIPLLFYFAPQQRYILDIMPFLFVLLVRAIAPTVPSPIKVLILLSFFLNFYLYVISLA